MRAEQGTGLLIKEILDSILGLFWVQRTAQLGQLGSKYQCALAVLGIRLDGVFTPGPRTGDETFGAVGIKE
ncbi:MAG: hypothetical protein ACO3S6_03670, partial [Aquiluna sp.]